MSQDKDAGALPGWTLLLPLAGCVAALAILWACQDAGLSWWIGVPVLIAVVVGGVFLEHAVERKYLPSRRSN
jgi:hypothetical protein